MSPRLRGFTLLELLIALSIFAVIGILAYGGLSTVIHQRALADLQAERWRDVQMAVRMLTGDLQQIHPRPVRDEIGNLHQGAVVAGGSGEYLLQFTRGGWSNPAGQLRSSQQRVAYLVENGELIRVYWPVLDRTLATDPVAAPVLDEVEGLEIRLLDWIGEWHTQWPPAAADPQDNLLRIPRAIEISLELADYGTLERLVITGQ